MESRGSHDLELEARVAERLPLAGVPQGLSHPFRHRGPLTAGNELNLLEFPFFQEDLKALTHSRESNRLMLMSQS